MYPWRRIGYPKASIKGKNGQGGHREPLRRKGKTMKKH